MNLQRYCLTFLTALLILVSSCLIIPVPAQHPPDKPPEEEPWWKQEQFNGTFFHWDQQQDAFSDSWSWLSEAWEFGPYPKLKIYLQNGTEVVDSNFIPLGDPFHVVIDIKKNIFTEDVTLGRAGLNWHTNIRSINGTETGNAECRMSYINYINTHYWNESQTWQVESFVFNETTKLGPPDQPPLPIEKGEASFYHFNEEASSVTETSDMWLIEIVGYFDLNATPVGPFWVNLEVTNSKDNWIDFGYVAWEERNSPHREVAVGKPGLFYNYFGDTWLFEKVDMENNPVYSVSKGDPWKMRINVTSSELANVTIGLEMNNGIKTYVNITGWFQTTVTEYGGWLFNETANTYYWNSTVPVTRTKEMYGPHLEERWIHVDHGCEVNVTRLHWDPVTGEERLETFLEWVPERLYLIYYHSNHSFAMKQGYSYWSYDVDLHRERDYQILYPLNTSDPTTQFYELSINDCNWQQLTSKTHMIEFAGIFSNTTYSDRDEYWIQEPIVYNHHERIWPNWETISPSDFQVAIDKLVAITTVLDKNGHKVTGWMFQTDPGDFFIIQSKLQGAGVKFKDIDGVGIVFRTSYGNWISEEENTWSDVEIRLVNDIATGVLTSTTYNRTSKNVYTYGPHRGWEIINVTDWHQEYNVTTGEWQWVKSTHSMWNETIVTDWHWEYLSLNQTEYALDPDSPTAWINRDDYWIPDDDPAFKMPTSYAHLNAATMSQIEGVVTAHLNITFTEEAPNTNYWWEMCFKNMTFDRDYSEGWGEHTLLQWGSDKTYYVNGSTTGNQPWYVTAPSTPSYTIVEGNKYTIEETPYIILGDEELLIDTRTQYDWCSQEDFTEFLFRDPYDPKLGTEPRYFELQNGTRIFVTEAYQAIIRTLTLNTTDVYKLDDTGIVSIPNGTIISTFMDHAMEKWDDQLQQHVFFYDLLNGTRVFKNDGFEIQFYNWTTNRWEITNPAYDEAPTSILVKRLGHGVTLNHTTTVYLRDYGSWWQPLSNGTGYYLITVDGTPITHPDPWSVPDEDRIVTIDGLNYTIGWPDEYYEGSYQNQTVNMRREHVHSFYYTDLGRNGVDYELPYPEAMAMSWWDLEHIESEGGRVKTFKSITINSTKYTLHPLENGIDFYIEVEGQPVLATPPRQDPGYFYAELNGEEYWNVEQHGWVVRIGRSSDMSGQFKPSGEPIVTTTGYDAQSQRWEEHNRWGYDRENSTLYLLTPNGTRYTVHSGIYLLIWKVQIGNETIFTMNSHDNWEMVEDPETGDIIQKSYVVTLDGTKMYFDWGKNPASWVEELHIHVPGTNYTRLIPFDWLPQSLFDTIYIHNITIPALPWDPTCTGVFFENGTEVPVNTTFKIYGTRWGPGTRQHYSYNDGIWTPEGAFIPSTEVPWNGTLHMQYFTTMNGNRLYSEYGFGWMGDRWGDPGIGELRQWNYINGNPTTGNKTTSVKEGGYCIFLNDTIKIDVTTEWTQGGWPDEYLIMKNGTYLSVHWHDTLHNYVTEIGNTTYFFRQVMTYYNATDSGTVYSIADPFNPDNLQILTATLHIVPTINPDHMAWIYMNSSSDAVLQDMLGHYLINVTDDSRLDLDLVDKWWASPEELRRNTFRNEWELQDAYPRYNLTINGQEYFVIDPSPVMGRWDGEGSVEWNMYRYPAQIEVTLDGSPYTIELFENSYWKPELRWRRIETVTLEGSSYEVEDQWSWKPRYEVEIDGQPTEIHSEEMNVYRKHTMWGEVYRWMLTDMQVYSLRSIWDIVVGTPEYGMWGLRAFAVVPETGAVDLDGDLTTTEDQYYVRRLHTGSDMWNRTEDRMFVEVVWNPNGSLVDDEIHVSAWMGKVHTEWAFTWNETYVWYYAGNMSVVSTSTMRQINTTVINSDTGIPKAGYWDIAHMTRNATWADLLDQADKEGWEWIENNKHEWDWLTFGTQQDYMTSWKDGNGTQKAGVGLRYEFAGLSLHNGTEQTHFFVPESVNTTRFVSPGEAFGNLNSTGEMIVPLNATIDFGVAYNNVTGALFPYTEDRSMWGWWDGMVYGADYKEPNFMNKPTRAQVDEMAFGIHFSANIAEETSENNNASMKIDQHIGNWDLPPNTIDGRTETQSNVTTFLRGNDVLINRSLAISYYVTAFTGVEWNVMDEEGAQLDNNNVTESATFDVAARLANASFASVKLGSTYDWYKPTSANDTLRTFNVTSKTTPIRTFEASFQSESGKSSTGFDISATMYFLSVGFPQWDGYSVYNDPELAIYAFKGDIRNIVPIPDSTPLILLITITTIAVLVTTIALKKGKLHLPKRKSMSERASKTTTNVHARTE